LAHFLAKRQGTIGSVAGWHDSGGGVMNEQWRTCSTRAGAIEEQTKDETKINTIVEKKRELTSKKQKSVQESTNKTSVLSSPGSRRGTSPAYWCQHLGLN